MRYALLGINYTTPHYSKAHYVTLDYLATATTTTTTTTTTPQLQLQLQLRLQLQLQLRHNCKYNYTTTTTTTTLHYTILQLQLQLQLQLPLHCKYNYHYNYNCVALRYTTLHPAVVGEVTTTATTPKITTTFRSIDGFALPSMHHINSSLL